MNHSINELLIYFSAYSFIGWMVESAFVSIRDRRLTNSGFLHGPFLPVYGLAACVIVVIDESLKDTFPLAARLLLHAGIASIIEYYAGVFLEEIFALKLWDYSDRAMNLNGRVCLQYSGYWLFLTFVLVHYLHPILLNGDLKLFATPGVNLGPIIVVYFLVDLFYSIRTINRFKDTLGAIKGRYLSFTAEASQKLLQSANRIMASFPNLKRYLSANLESNIKDRTTAYLSGALASKKMEHPGEVPGMKQVTLLQQDDHEYQSIVRDILNNHEFQKLRDFKHHNASILEHVKLVSYLSYSLCKRFGIDHVSAARGALLHDFFLYDWRKGQRNNGKKARWHATRHPKIALEMSQKNFSLNEKEKDIIEKHMWPITVRLPKYKESLVVGFVDKFVASKEFLKAIQDKVISLR